MQYRKAIVLGWLMVLVATLGLSGLPTVQGQNKSNEQGPPQEVIKLDTSLVTVPVIVTDRYGRFVSGLTRQEFQVREDGLQQELASFSSTEAPFNVALLIDTSRSTRTKLGAIRKAALEFIKQLQPQDRVLIVTFDERVQILGDFTSDRGQLARAIRSVKSSYMTSLYDAIHLTITQKLAPLAGRKALVVLSDGVDTYSRQATYQSSLELVANTGVISYAVQYETRNEGGPATLPSFRLPPARSFLGSSFISAWPTWQGQRQSEQDRYHVASEYLRALAVQSGARLLRAESIENTSYAFALIADELRHQYTLTYYSTNEKRDGAYRAIAVRLNRPELEVRSRLGYRVPKADPVEGIPQQQKPAEKPKPEDR
jgi:Ca-activated chloride channel homolog